MSGLRLRRINCECGNPNAIVSYQVTKKRIYADKQCLKCGRAAFCSFERKDVVDAKIPLAKGAWKI